MDSLERELSAAIAALSPDRELAVLDLTVPSQRTLSVYLDSTGVPQVREVPRQALAADDLSGKAVVVYARPGSVLPAAVRQLLHDKPSARLLESRPGNDLRAVLGRVVADSPIRQPYELVLARASPDGGRIHLTSAALFPLGSKRGATAELTVNSVCTDDAGTVLAVVARDQSEPAARLIAAYSVRLAPGPLLVRATLAAPGAVQFAEPAGVTPETRPLNKLMAAIPPSLNSVDEAHLICAVDTTGAASAVAARLYHVEKFITSMQAQFPGNGHIKVGLVAYGAHRRRRRQKDDRVVMTDWASEPAQAARSLGKLGAAWPDEDGAAQVEDALAAIESQLRRERQSQRTALIIFGDGQPYPAKETDALPACPKGHNWERIAAALRNQGCSLAAIRDRPSRQGARAWRRLGSGMVFAVDSFSADVIGKRTGLVVPSLEHMPFPLEMTGKEATEKTAV